MKTPICDMLGIELPLFAFSHCRDVVVEVSRAGGMGVLGASGFEAEQLEQELQWIDQHIEGRPYGVDLLIPNTYQQVDRSKDKLDLTDLLPEGHRRFVHDICDEAGMPPLPEEERTTLLEAEARHINMTPEDARELLNVALAHPVSLIVNALGTPDKNVVEELHTKGIKVGSLIGKAGHVKAQLDAGVDVLVAQGSEAGGHTGQVTSMVLWPQIVDLAAPVPVLAAGGIGRGRQMAAALALGADGIWCGSIWLGTAQSEVFPMMKQRLFEANSEDAIQTRALTGKPCRALKSNFTEAWDREGAPRPLPMPLQSLVGSEARLRIQRGQAKDWMTYPVGQIVGDMKSDTSVRNVIQKMLAEFLDSVERLNTLVGDDD